MTKKELFEALKDFPDDRRIMCCTAALSSYFVKGVWKEEFDHIGDCWIVLEIDD